MMRPLPGVLLADEELAIEPTHMTIVGQRKPRAPASCMPWRARCGPLQAAGVAGPARRPNCPTPTSNIPTSANPRHSPAATASARSLVQCRGIAGTVKQMAKLKPARAALN